MTAARESGGEERGGRVTATRKTSLMTDKDARQDNTEHRGAGRWGWR